MTRSEIRKNSLTLFKIPNNRTGRVLRRLRTYAEPGVRVRARGRTPRDPQHRAWGFTPHKNACSFGVYIQKTGLEAQDRADRTEKYELRASCQFWQKANESMAHANENMRSEINTLRSELADARESYCNIESTIADLPPLGSWSAVWFAFLAFVRVQIWRK